jgi:hypothetical protein
LIVTVPLNVPVVAATEPPDKLVAVVAVVALVADVAVAALPVQEADEPVIDIPQEPDAPEPVKLGEYDV